MPTDSFEQEHSQHLMFQQSQYLTFQIAGEEYAVGILQVREIIQCEAITKVPKTAPWIRGVINLRGRVVPVVDLAVKFALRETPIARETCIVITEIRLDDEQTVMGVLADAVCQVVALKQDEIAPPPAFATAVHPDFLVGMCKAGKKLILMLDVDRVFASTTPS